RLRQERRTGCAKNRRNGYSPGQECRCPTLWHDSGRREDHEQRLRPRQAARAAKAGSREKLRKQIRRTGVAKITDTAALRELLGTPNESVRQKIHPELNARAVDFIRRSPFLMLSTADEHGIPTVSPKGDPAGFVHVEDSRTLIIPER